MIVCTPVPLLLVREPPLDNLARTRHSTLWPLASVMPAVVTPRFFAHFPHTSTFSLASSWPFRFCSREFSFLASFSFFLSCESGEMEIAFDILMRGWGIDDLKRYRNSLWLEMWWYSINCNFFFSFLWRNRNGWLLIF